MKSFPNFILILSAFFCLICCLTVKGSFKVCNLQVMKKIHLEKSNQKNRTGKGKKYIIDILLQYAVVVRILRSTCKKNKLFIHHIVRKLCWRILLKSLYCIVNLHYWLELFETKDWNISLTKRNMSKI